MEILIDKQKGNKMSLKQRINIWGKVFENGESKICGRQPLKKLK